MTDDAVLGAVQRSRFVWRCGETVLRCVMQLDREMRIVAGVAVQHRLERHHDRERHEHAREPSPPLPRIVHHTTD